MNSVIVMSHNDPHLAGGDPSKTKPSASVRLAATRQNDTFRLIFSEHTEAGVFRYQRISFDW